MRAKILGLLAMGLLGSASVTNAATVDFSLAPGSFSSYSEQGAIFTAVNGGFIDATYGPNTTTSIISATGNTPLQEIRADISGGAGFVAVDLGDFGFDDDLLFLEVFNSGGTLLGSTTSLLIDENPSMRTLSLARANIAYAIFGSRSPSLNGSSVYADNFTWTLAAPVPLPAAAWLLLSGIAGLGLLGRRRKAA